MNKITGANKLSSVDVSRIEMLVKRSLTNSEISEVTGWSIPVINKIRNGSYYELNARVNEKRQAEREKKKKTIPPLFPFPSLPFPRKLPIIFLLKSWNGFVLPLNTITPF